MHKTWNKSLTFHRGLNVPCLTALCGISNEAFYCTAWKVLIFIIYSLQQLTMPYNPIRGISNGLGMFVYISDNGLYWYTAVTRHVS